MSRQAYRALRKITPSDQLLRRRAAGASLRELALDAGVSHQALSAFFRRPEVVARLRSFERVERAGAKRERPVAADLLEPAGDPATWAERHAPPAPTPGRAGRRRSHYEEWLDTPKNLSGRALAEASGLVRLRNPEGTVTRWVEATEAPALLEEGWSRA